MPLFRWLLLVCLGLGFVTQVALAQPRKILRYGNGTEPQDIDPHVITGTPEHHLLIALNEGLVSPSPRGDGVEPAVAASWTVSEDQRTYTFRLRPEARWSEGTPVTAFDFLHSYRRVLTPSLAADNAYRLFALEGAEAFYRGEQTDFTRVGVAAPDEHTLILRLRRATPFFVDSLHHPIWQPVPIAVVEKFGGMTKKGTAWTRLENFVSNGPFRLRNWEQNQRIVVERNPHYWDRATVRLDEIHFFPIELGDTEEKMFRADQLDITGTIPVSKIATYQKNSPEVLSLEPAYGLYFYRINTKKKPLDDVRVRRALSLAVDRETLVTKVTRGGQKPALSIVPPGVKDYAPSHTLTPEVAEAQRLLAEAGYPGGEGFPRTQVLYNTSDGHRAIAEALQQRWKKTLGIEVTLTNLEWKVYLDAQQNGDFQLCRAGWLADYLDPHTFLDLWQTGNANNQTGWGSLAYDELLERSLHTANQAERYAVYQQMEKILLEEMPIIPLYFYTRPRLIQTRVLHYRTNPLDDFPFKHVDLQN